MGAEPFMGAEIRSKCVYANRVDHSKSLERAWHTGHAHS